MRYIGKNTSRIKTSHSVAPCDQCSHVNVVNINKLRKETLLNFITVIKVQTIIISFSHLGAQGIIVFKEPMLYDDILKKS